MCGIFGYVGKRNAVKAAIEGLHRLEYRGYDSAGIAGISDGKVVSSKEVGKVSQLERKIEKEGLTAETVIAHTRWATHGVPTEVNAHPHFDEALKLVNDHEYGNGVSIFTRDGDAGRSFSSKAKIGMVGINIPIPVPMAFHSFGGWKRSLFGDQHMHGPEGVRFYTKLKTITSRWPTGLRSDPEFTMPTMK